MELEPDDPAEGEKARTRWEALLALYPRERAREMVQAYLDALPVDDAVILPDTSAEELEAEMATLDGDLEDAPPEALAEIDAFKQLFRDARGKRPSELPQPKPEELAEEIEREAETAVAQLTSGWINMLYFASDRASGADVVLTGDLLEATPPVMLGMSAKDGVHWLEAVCVSIALTHEQARELQALWVSNLRSLLDAAPDGYVLWDEKYVIKKDVRGYVLTTAP